MLTVPTMASWRHTAKMDTLSSQADAVNDSSSSQLNKQDLSSSMKHQVLGNKKPKTEESLDTKLETDKRKHLSSEKGQVNSLDKQDGAYSGMSISNAHTDGDKGGSCTKIDQNSTAKHNEHTGKQVPDKSSPVVVKITFDCSCGRTFETQRGLSLHLSHYPSHSAKKRDKTPPSHVPTSKPIEHTPTVSEPVSPRIKSMSPVDSTDSSPSSPSAYNLSAFKTSARNPQYYSIIRTRSSVAEEGGNKRARGTTGPIPGAPPTKTLQLNSGEKVPAGELSDDSDKDKESPVNKRRSLKEGETKKTTAAKHRPRTRSFSNSDPISPTLKTSPEAMSDSMASSGAGSLKNSPVTRSNAATMKAPEFISLPSRRKRGGKRGGRGRGTSFSGRGSEDVEMGDETIGENFPSSPKSKKTPTELEPPMKRKRGRPPKNRKESSPGPSPKKNSGEPSKGVGQASKTTKKETTKATRGKDSIDEDSNQSDGENENSKLPQWEAFGNEAENETKKVSSSTTSQTPPTIPETTPTHVSSAYVVTSQKDSSGSFKAVTVTTLGKKGGSKESVKEGSKTSKSRKSTRKSSQSNVDTNEDAPGSSSTNESVEEGVAETESTHKQKNESAGKTRTRSKSTKSKVDKESNKTDKETTAEKKSESKKDEEPVTSSPEVKDDQPPRSVIVNVLSREGQPPNSGEEATKNANVKSPSNEQEITEPANNNIRRVSTQEPPFPPSSSPTYAPPYHFPSPYPHPAPIMYPPGSSMYHHPYYGYPGGPPSGGHPHQVSPYGHHMPPGMVVPPGHVHPGPPMAPAEQHMSPHSGPTPFQQFTSNSGSQVTTVSGVQVSVLDKPPTQLPTVTVPIQMSSSSMPSGGRPRSMYPIEGNSPGNPMPPQAILQSYMQSAGMTSPPNDVAHQHAHPLSHAYRQGVMPPPHGIPGYPPMPHPQSPYHPHPHLAVRLDPSGMPYMEWAPDHKPPPPEEPPARPVECPECGRMFKNNKALNGHMRLHGGFDWTKKPFTALDQSKTANSTSANNTKTTTNNKTSEDGKQNTKKPKAATSRKRSRSGSRSRSRSKSPSVAKANSIKRRRSSDDTKTKSSKGGKESLTPLPVPRAPNIFTFDKVEGSHAHASSSSQKHTDQQHHSQGHNATLDDLCRAAALLDSIDSRGEDPKKGNPLGREDPDSEFDENGRRRPKNITIPQSQSTPVIERERLRLGATPPYTPPPILSPSRSLTMLATGITPQPGTPCRILSHWSSRRSSDGHPLSESDESYNEPRINVGKDFQAELPVFNEFNASALQADPKSIKVWQVLDDLTQEDESTIDGYLEIACSPAVLHSGRNKEMALHSLYQLGGSVKEAVRCMLAGKSVFTSSHPMSTYNYSGSRRWSGRERQQFRRAWRVHRKQFHLLRSAVESKGMSEVIEYYYTWKKYCSDEYRGRNRHFSEEILSDEDVGEIRSSSSEASGENDTPPFASHAATKKHPVIKREKVSPPLIDPKTLLKHSRPLVSQMQNSIDGDYEHLPIVYAPHTSQPAGQSVHQYKCKYPGCNQVFTSIFALNGHIRVHGGSFYPKPHLGGPSQPSKAMPSTNLQNSTHANNYLPIQGKPPSNKLLEPRSQQQLELAKALLELPQPRSPARRIGYNTPSPKPSPKSRSPASNKKKLSSSSPGEREGYYPCNRCGRVFTKVKSRSAHMKSHIVKQN